MIGVISDVAYQLPMATRRIPTDGTPCGSGEELTSSVSRDAARPHLSSFNDPINAFSTQVRSEPMASVSGIDRLHPPPCTVVAHI